MITYIFFNSDDPEAEPMTNGKSTTVLRTVALPTAVAQAALWITNEDETVVHIFSDDGQSIHPVLTMRAYEKPAPVSVTKQKLIDVYYNMIWDAVQALAFEDLVLYEIQNWHVFINIAAAVTVNTPIKIPMT